MQGLERGSRGTPCARALCFHVSNTFSFCLFSFSFCLFVRIGGVVCMGARPVKRRVATVANVKALPHKCLGELPYCAPRLHLATSIRCDTYKTKLKLDKEVGGVGFWGFCAGMEMFAFLFGMKVCV